MIASLLHSFRRCNGGQQWQGVSSQSFRFSTRYLLGLRLSKKRKLISPDDCSSANKCLGASEHDALFSHSALSTLQDIIRNLLSKRVYMD